MARVFSSDSHIIGSAPLTVQKPRVVKGWWSDINDKEIERARLEERVRFHIETEYVPDNTSMKMQLFDRDRLTPDDSDFDNEKVFKDIIIRHNKGCLELELPESWTQDLADEPFVSYRKLYWKAEIGHTKKEIKSYLKVFFSDRTLYVQPSQIEKKFPEIYGSDGSQMVAMMLDQIVGYVRDQSGQYIERFISKMQTEIVLAKLEKGYLADSNGKVHSNITQSGKQRRIVFSELYASESSNIIHLEGNKDKIIYKRGADFGNTHTTTKGVNQFEFFSRTNKKVRILGALKNNWEKNMTRYDLAKELYNVHSGNTEGLMDNTLVTLGSVISTGVGIGVGAVLAMGNDHWDEMDEIVNGAIIRQYTEELNQAKQQGLNAVEKWVRNNRQRLEGVEYGLMPVSYETASKIWMGKFKTWEEMRTFDFDLEFKKNHILYRRQKDAIRKEEIYIIETFFIE